MGEMVIRGARNLLLVVQNDSSLSIVIERLIEGRSVTGTGISKFDYEFPIVIQNFTFLAGEEMTALIKILEEFDAYAVSSIGVPYEARTQVS